VRMIFESAGIIKLVLTVKAKTIIQLVFE